MTFVVPLSAQFSRLILLLRFSALIVFRRVKSLLNLLNKVYESPASSFAINDQLKSSKLNEGAVSKCSKASFIRSVELRTEMRDRRAERVASRKGS